MTEVAWSEHYKPIVKLLHLRAGLSFDSSRRDAVEQAIRQTMQLAGCSDTVDYLRLLKDDADALDDLLVTTTVGESYFFRDSGQFRIISDLILPDIRRRLGPGHAIRLWSAGCSSGEEAYSMAMMLHRNGALSQATVLGTDISREALERARTAVYSQRSLRGTDAELAKSYLTQKDARHHVNATIAKSVRFEHLNLALDNYPSVASGTRGMDLIMCRNVLINFDERTLQSVVARLFRSLADGGWLITGTSDPPIFEYEAFDFVPTEDGLAYRKANHSLGAASVAEPDGSDEPSAKLSEPNVKTSEAVSVPASEAVPVAKTLDTLKTTKPSRSQMLAEARQALAEGDCQRAADLTRDLRGEGVLIHIKAMANIDVGCAAKACAAATSKRPFSQELHYLLAVLLMDLNRHDEAIESLRRVLYLDGSLALAHFSLGAALRTQGDAEGAKRAFRNTLEICDRSTPDQPVPFGDDETVGELRALAKTQLDSIGLD